MSNSRAKGLSQGASDVDCSILMGSGEVGDPVVPVEHIKNLFYPSHKTNYFLTLLKHSCVLWSSNNHHRATNTKSQSKVYYNAIIFTLWGPITSQYSCYK